MQGHVPHDVHINVNYVCIKRRAGALTLHLTHLSDSFGQLRALTTFKISDCEKITLYSLAASFGNLSALTTLEMQGQRPRATLQLNVKYVCIKRRAGDMTLHYIFIEFFFQIF